MRRVLFIGESLSAVATVLASSRGLRLSCLAWIAAFAVLGVLGVAARQLGQSVSLDPVVVGFFMPSREWSLPSVFGYLTALAAAVALFACHRRSERFGYLAWAMVMLAICLDDAFEYHERVGELIAARFGAAPVLGLRAQDVGEVIAWALMGVVVLPAALSALRATDRATRELHAVFFPLFGVLLVFAVGMDVVHLVGPGGLQPLLGLAEDGGEIVALGLMAAAASAFLARERGAPLSLRIGPIPHNGALVSPRSPEA